MNSNLNLFIINSWDLILLFSKKLLKVYFLPLLFDIFIIWGFMRKTTKQIMKEGGENILE